MRSNRAKVLHEIAGVPMIRYVVETALSTVDHVVVVIGHQAERVRKALRSYPTLLFAVQEQQLGTGHAVTCAMSQVPADVRDVVVLCGDTPLIKATTVRNLIDQHRATNSYLSLLATTLAEPFGYGRIVLDASGNPVRIVEESDADGSEKKIELVNTGTYCIRKSFLRRALAGLKDDNRQGEFYLTDVVERAYQEGTPAVLLRVVDAIQVTGVNTREELAKVEGLVTSGRWRREPESS